jgi:hypothetical protein
MSLDQVLLHNVFYLNLADQSRTFSQHRRYGQAPGLHMAALAIYLSKLPLDRAAAQGEAGARTAKVPLPETAVKGGSKTSTAPTRPAPCSVSN